MLYIPNAGYQISTYAPRWVLYENATSISAPRPASRIAQVFQFFTQHYSTESKFSLAWFVQAPVRFSSCGTYDVTHELINLR